MKTNLYLPFTSFQINNEDGNKILYENLVQSGPAYKLIVHESPSWLAIKDEMPYPDMIEIIPEKKAEEYKEIVNRFFAPITEVASIVTVRGENTHIENLYMNLRRALSYILIGYDYKARIYEDDILREAFCFSDTLKEHQDVFSEEVINRVVFTEQLLAGYKKDSIETISINEDERIFDDLMDLLDRDEIKLLSEKNYLFGTLSPRMNILKREIKELINEILGKGWLPYLVNAPTLVLYYFDSAPKIMKLISYAAGVSSIVLRNYKFNEFIPPIQNPRLFELVRGPTGSFIYSWFNYEYKILIPQEHV